MGNQSWGSILTKPERKRLLISFFFVLLWCVVAHGYCFSHFSISHDSLKEFNAYDMHYRSGFQGTNIQWKVALGRFIQPVYLLIVRGAVTSPWLTGLLTVVWLSLAVYLTARLFSIQSAWHIGLTAGLFCVNLPVIAAASTYIHDLDSSMFAVFAAALGAYLWGTDRRPWLAVIPLIVALGIYQSMISVAVVLMMLACLMRLMDGQPAKTVLLQGVKAIALLAVAGGAYWLLMRLACKLAGTELVRTSNGLVHFGDFLHTSIPGLLKDTYVSVARQLLFPPSLTSNRIITSATALLLLAGALAVLVFLLKKTIAVGAKLLALALIALLPLGMNLSGFINAGSILHMLMLFACCLAYQSCLLLARWLAGQIRQRRNLARAIRLCCGALVALVLWMNVQTANAVYVKKEIERQESYSLMTRVIGEIERTEGYVPGETKVAFFTKSIRPRTPAFKELYSITGQKYTNMITEQSFVYAFFEYGLNAGVNLVDYSDLGALKDFAGDMPCYPAKGSIAWQDDVLVVKLAV